MYCKETHCYLQYKMVYSSSSSASLYNSKIFGLTTPLEKRIKYILLLRTSFWKNSYIFDKYSHKSENIIRYIRIFANKIQNNRSKNILKFFHKLTPIYSTLHNSNTSPFCFTSYLYTIKKKGKTWKKKCHNGWKRTFKLNKFHINPVSCSQVDNPIQQEL